MVVNSLFIYDYDKKLWEWEFGIDFIVIVLFFLNSNIFIFYNG